MTLMAMTLMELMDSLLVMCHMMITEDNSLYNIIPIKLISFTADRSHAMTLLSMKIDLATVTATTILLGKLSAAIGNTVRRMIRIAL